MKIGNGEKNIAVSKVNGYTLELVRLAKQYLDEIGKNRRSFPLERLVEMYNTLKGTHETAKGCKPCGMAKYYNGIQNFYTYGKMTLISVGKATEEDFATSRSVPKNEAPELSAKAAVNEAPEPEAVEVKEEKVIEIPDPKAPAEASADAAAELSVKAEKPKKAEAPKKKAKK